MIRNIPSPPFRPDGLDGFLTMSHDINIRGCESPIYDAAVFEMLQSELASDADAEANMDHMYNADRLSANLASLGLPVNPELESAVIARDLQEFLAFR